MNDFLKGFRYAANGIRVALREQRNIRIQTGIALITIAAGVYFDITVTEWCLILFSIGLVIGLELVNSSIESLVDLVTRERKPLAGKVKDIAAGAVLFVSIIAVIIGILIFQKYLF